MNIQYLPTKGMKLFMKREPGELFRFDLSSDTIYMKTTGPNSVVNLRTGELFAGIDSGSETWTFEGTLIQKA